MFYAISKVLGWIINPLHLGLTLLGIALVLRLLKRRARARRWLAIAACVEMWIFSLRLVSEPLVWGLEHQFPREPSISGDPGAIVLLCGMTRVPARGSYELTDAGDRLVETVRLAHRFPAARVVVSGAFVDNYGAEYSEARTLEGLLTDMGVSADRIVVDERSRNTFENAKETERLLAGVDGPILLVTSAMHMPRAAGCFKKAGVKVTPWPVDYRMKGLGLRGLFPGVEDMAQSNDALHEYFGYAAYWASGYL
jgi:uncharacterized SAM-binding protein YcdF (DUF218 family)